MTISSPSLLAFSVCLLVFFYGSLAQLGYDQSQGRSPWHSQHGFRGQRACRFERLSTLEFMQRIESEAGYTEYLQESNEQLQCAGISASRRVIEPQGLTLPSYSNAPRLVYIVRGRGLTGTIFPGCPETYQSFQHPMEHQMEEGGSLREKFRDEHQKIHRFREGDILALPAGVAHWCYNDGDSPVIAVTVFDTSNNANQLDARHREFLLAGRHQRQGQKFPSEGLGESEERRSMSGMNILSGFDVQMLAEALGVSNEMVRKLQGQNDQRGEIVRVRRGLHMMRPARMQESQPQQNDEDPEAEEEQPESNGLDETFCNMKTRANINDPSLADVYNPHAGRITNLNSQKLSILNIVQMSANRVVLYRNATLTPYWNINAHSLMYVTSREAGRVQIVDNRGRTAFDGELYQGQVLIIPQHYAVVKRAERGRFSWVSFNTNSNAMVSQMAGKASIFRGMPVDVLTNAYRLSREEARMLKFNRGNEMSIFASRFGRGSSSE